MLGAGAVGVFGEMEAEKLVEGMRFLEVGAAEDEEIELLHVACATGASFFCCGLWGLASRSVWF
jgi:hypothetical protein